VPTVAWGVVVPVKRLALAKTRLVIDDDSRERLALAFAEDVVLAALSCQLVRRVLVVTDDPRAAAAVAALGADVAPDRPDAGLNPALAHGAQVLRAQDARLGVATVSSDLPALRADDLAEMLAAAVTRTFVADAAGIGTTVLAAPGGTPLDPRYGPASRAAHRASGAVETAGAASLRRDVDTPADLADALELGVGPRTAGAVAALGR
jgi:2-phospho-L-lactate guanylyltransferase